MSKRAITIDQLSVNYGTTSAIWDLTLSIEKGSLVGVIGPNGAGKSTLLKALLGLIKPLSGSVRFMGRPLKEVASQVAYIPQKGEVDWNFPMTAFDVVLMGRYRKLKGLKWYRRADKEAALKMLEHLGMAALANRPICALSGGQQQRLFIARALLQEAEIFLLDEPFAAVDQATEELIITLLKELRDRGKTLLVVHHNLNNAASHFDQILLLNTCLIAFGKSEEALSSDNLARAYGGRAQLFEEALSLSRRQKEGRSL